MIWTIILMRLKSAAGALWGAITRYPLPCALIAALCLAGWCWRGWSHERAGRRDDAERVAAAQVKATAAQVAVNRAPAILSQVIARKSDVDSVEYYAKGRAAGLAYADSHRVRACPGPAIAADLPGADHIAPVNDGQGADAIVVARADFDLLTSNSLRLAKVREDASALIAAGAAVSAE